MGGRHLVGDPDPVARCRLLYADGGVRPPSPTVIACNKREAFVHENASDEAIQTAFFGLLDCFACAMMLMNFRRHVGTQEKRAEPARL